MKYKLLKKDRRTSRTFCAVMIQITNLIAIKSRNTNVLNKF